MMRHEEIPQISVVEDEDLPQLLFRETDARFNHHMDGVDDDDNNYDGRSDVTTTGRKIVLKIGIGVLMVTIFVLVVVDFLSTHYIQNFLYDFLNWLEINPTRGIFYFAVTYFVATALFVPAALLSLGAGYVFANAFGLVIGIGIASGSVFIASFCESIVSFLLGRYLLRDWIEELTKESVFFEALDIALEKKGIHIITLLRLAPLMPVNVVNYVGGFSSIPFWKFCLGSIAIYPSALFFVIIGASANSLAELEEGGSGSESQHVTVLIVFVLLGVALGLIAILLTNYYSTKELKRILASRAAEIEQIEAFTPYPIYIKQEEERQRLSSYTI